VLLWTTAAPERGHSSRKTRTEREIIEAALVASRAFAGRPASTLEHKIRALKIRKNQFRFG
jgi:hypothetical protein